MKVEQMAISGQVSAAVSELLGTADLQPGKIVVVGCSTSEVQGAQIGSGGSLEVANAILAGLKSVCDQRGILLAIQCCEHLNRSLVVERETAEIYGLEEVMVIPVPEAGGALAAAAIRQFPTGLVVETIQAHAGLDIGQTLIGMHLKPVAVPVRLSQSMIGQAQVTAAYCRPKLIGGQRAVYITPSG